MLSKYTGTAGTKRAEGRQQRIFDSGADSLVVHVEPGLHAFVKAFWQAAAICVRHI
jgi:hypothetical protein